MGWVFQPILNQQAPRGKAKANASRCDVTNRRRRPAVAPLTGPLWLLLRHVLPLTDLQRWAVQLSERIGHNRAAVALANKLVRICRAVWRHERHFDGSFQANSRLTAA